MNINEPLARRDLLATLGQWSAAALSIAGLGGLSTACGGHHHAAPPPPYSDYSNYANYFDYSNYSNYGDYLNAPYHDYADYGDYANYGDYFNYADAYSDGYADYLNYANYSDYLDYSNYSDYSDYSDYVDYSDYSDSPDDSDSTGDLKVRRPKPRGNYADYADVYADSGGPPGAEGSTAPRTGRARVVRPPFRGGRHALTRGGVEGVRGPTWVDLPETRMDQESVSTGSQPRESKAGSQGESEDLHGLAHQGLPKELKRPVKQKEGRSSRQIAGPSNRQGGPKGGPETDR